MYISTQFLINFYTLTIQIHFLLKFLWKEENITHSSRLDFSGIYFILKVNLQSNQVLQVILCSCYPGTMDICRT